MYQISGSGIWSQIFAVPCDIVDKHLRLCGALPLKVLMLLLRHQRPFSPEELASLLGQSVPDVQDAVNYWEALGIISRAGSSHSPAAIPQTAEPPASSRPAAPELAEPGEPRVVKVGRSRPRLTSLEITDMAGQDATVGALLREAQAALGRPLKPLESETIATLYCYDGISPDILLMVLQYCISIDKASMGYLEKVALDWLDRGVDTHEKAEEEILRLTRVSEAEGALRSAFGIYGRKITGREAAFFESWQKELGFSLPLIKLAYERTVESKGKLSFPYINGILLGWHKKGITTPEKAKREMLEGSEKFAAKAREGSEPPGGSRDKFDQVTKQSKVFDDL